MALFNIGDKVIKIDNGARGTVVDVKSGRGRVLYAVIFTSGTTNVLECDLCADFIQEITVMGDNDDCIFEVNQKFF